MVPFIARIPHGNQRKDGGALNRLGFLILSVLSKSGAVDRKSAMTVREIAEAEDLGYKDNTVYKKATEFETAGYVAAGYKDGKAKTFYITDAGRCALDQS
jgi:hypothetical protein